MYIFLSYVINGINAPNTVDAKPLSPKFHALNTCYLFGSAIKWSAFDFASFLAIK